MRFGWDARKSTRNLRERGFDFEFATLIFEDPTLEREDDRRDYGERRVIALGEADGIGLAVVYTDRAGVGDGILRRIISARVSSRREREAYEEAIRSKSSGPAGTGRSGSTAPGE
ncbi:MAG: BrnT family toxin [Acidobacteria bacterium]|nr:BrnT family toxin [Acidobacteriota bacterium]